jgi:hypothetical protein
MAESARPALRPLSALPEAREQSLLDCYGEHSEAMLEAILKAEALAGEPPFESDVIICPLMRNQS